MKADKTPLASLPLRGVQLTLPPTVSMFTYILHMQSHIWSGGCDTYGVFVSSLIIGAFFTGGELPQEAGCSHYPNKDGSDRAS